MKKSILAILAIAAAGSVMAETQPYATITNAQGLSTVSVGNKLVNASSGMALAEGAQVLTTAKSAVTVDFAGGCTAIVKAGQSLNVNLADCKSLVASTKLNSGGGAAAGGMSEGFDAMSTPQKVALGAAVVAVVYYATKSDNKKTPAPVVKPPVAPTPVAVAPEVVPPAPISGS